MGASPGRPACPTGLCFWQHNPPSARDPFHALCKSIRITRVTKKLIDQSGRFKNERGHY